MQIGRIILSNKSYNIVTFPHEDLFILPSRVHIALLSLLQISLILSLNCPLLDIKDPRWEYDLQVSIRLSLKVKLFPMVNCLFASITVFYWLHCKFPFVLVPL